jgi:uncharacterized protein YecE (DUF72 family)
MIAKIAPCVNLSRKTLEWGQILEVGGLIRVGVAGWDYPDWAGIVYPAPLPRDFDRLGFLSEYFDAVEINVTFYRQPVPKSVRSWAGRVQSGGSFRFTAKLFQALTHRGRTPGSAPASTGTVDLKAEADRFREGIDPLHSAGLLAGVLMQFPQSFHDRAPNRDHLGALAGFLRGLPLIAELRHRSWNHDDALRFLAGLGIGFCNVDQPRIGATLPPTAHVTSPLAYIRLHGRNAANWFDRRAGPASRYDYFYSMEELDPWVERALALADRAEEVFIIANNHYRGKGPANALMLKAALARRRVPAPPELIAAYPALGKVTRPAATGPAQGRLF